ncbi:hypothetical protein L249_7994 [Ophiocordyceps polyrhachis-furcata BCC 54312]|uniref:Uncharacterized protein n=1 Tax=Ophiocordyceps polyrhachis-furcata BCC 54312 TaxID=1330021 RepID=A0A367LHX0_9HYPO|nr:hypothetical protein L249_7994 [Ophiocordyceps polyrhachis-furcata BCC 54312]
MSVWLVFYLSLSLSLSTGFSTRLNHRPAAGPKCLCNLTSHEPFLQRTQPARGPGLASKTESDSD